MFFSFFDKQNPLSKNAITLKKLLEEVIIGNEVQKSKRILSGLTFAITGSLPSLSRDEAKELIEKHDGKVVASVSKNTNYLLAGDGGGGKRKDAEKNGVKIITEAELKNML